MVSAGNHVKSHFKNSKKRIYVRWSYDDRKFYRFGFLLWTVTSNSSSSYINRPSQSFLFFCFLEAVDSFVEESGIRSFVGSLQDGSLTQVLSVFRNTCRQTQIICLSGFNWPHLLHQWQHWVDSAQLNPLLITLRKIQRKLLAKAITGAVEPTWSSKCCSAFFSVVLLSIWCLLNFLIDTISVLL